MANLDNFRGDGEQSIPNNITTWTETGTHATAAVTVTHAAETDKTHYLCGVAVSCGHAVGEDPDPCLVTIVDGVATILAWTVAGVGVKDVGANGGSGVVTFPHPIEITEGQLVSVTVTPEGTTTRVSCNAWGFTNDTRIE